MEVPNRKPVASSAASSCADLGVMRSRSLSRKLNSLTDRCTFVQAHEAWQMIQMIYPSHKMPSVWLARAQFMCESQFLTRELCSMLHCDVFVWHSKGKQLEVEKGSALLERAGGEEQFLAEVCTLEYLESHGTSWKKQSR